MNIVPQTYIRVVHMLIVVELWYFNVVGPRLRAICNITTPENERIFIYFVPIVEQSVVSWMHPYIMSWIHPYLFRLYLRGFGRCRARAVRHVYQGRAEAEPEGQGEETNEGGGGVGGEGSISLYICLSLKLSLSLLSALSITRTHTSLILSHTSLSHTCTHIPLSFSLTLSIYLSFIYMWRTGWALTLLQ